MLLGVEVIVDAGQSVLCNVPCADSLAQSVLVLEKILFTRSTVAWQLAMQFLKMLPTLLLELTS